MFFVGQRRNFCELQKDVGNSNLENLKIQLFEVELNDLVKKNLEIIYKMENDISGVIWVAGYTGDGNEELKISVRLKKILKLIF